jgi:3-oxoacyl-[acyl-carrier-protein] synthase-3
MANQTVITGTGCYIPPVIKTNQEFVAQTFYAEDQKKIDADGNEIVEKFKEITGIEERRYAERKVALTLRN